MATSRPVVSEWTSSYPAWRLGRIGGASARHPIDFDRVPGRRAVPSRYTPGTVRSGAAPPSAANPLLVEFGVAAGANLAIEEQVDVVEEPLFLALDDERAIVASTGASPTIFRPGYFPGCDDRRCDRRSRVCRVDTPLPEREKGVGLVLIRQHLPVGVIRL